MCLARAVTSTLASPITLCEPRTLPGLQTGAVKLVLWRHWMHLNFMHPVTSENQFHCTRLYGNITLCLVYVNITHCAWTMWAPHDGTVCGICTITLCEPHTLCVDYVSLTYCVWHLYNNIMWASHTVCGLCETLHGGTVFGICTITLCEPHTLCVDYVSLTWWCCVWHLYNNFMWASHTVCGLCEYYTLCLDYVNHHCFTYKYHWLALADGFLPRLLAIVLATLPWWCYAWIMLGENLSKYCK